MKYVNLTSHPIHLVDERGNSIKIITPSGLVARMNDKKKKSCNINGVNIYELQESYITGLPEEDKNTIYIVSQIILRAIGNKRKDICTPLPISRYRKKTKAASGLYRIGEEWENEISTFII